MNCFNPVCSQEISGRTYAKHTNAGLIFFCSPGCKAAAASGSTITPETARRTGAERRKRRKPGDISETELSKLIADDQKKFAPYSTRLQSGQLKIPSTKYGKPYFVHLCTPGTPDRMSANRLIVFFEVKAKDETASAEQKKIHEILKKNGALCFVIDSMENYYKIKAALLSHRAELNKIADRIADIQRQIEIEISE